MSSVAFQHHKPGYKEKSTYSDMVTFYTWWNVSHISEMYFTCPSGETAHRQFNLVRLREHFQNFWIDVTYTCDKEPIESVSKKDAKLER